MQRHFKLPGVIFSSEGRTVSTRPSRVPDTKMVQMRLLLLTPSCIPWKGPLQSFRLAAAQICRTTDLMVSKIAETGWSK